MIVRTRTRTFPLWAPPPPPPSLTTFPAASALLLHFVAALGGPAGLQHPDAYVRQSCVDLLGVLLTRLQVQTDACQIYKPFEHSNGVRLDLAFGCVLIRVERRFE
jgi:hypothetical protein